MPTCGHYNISTIDHIDSICLVPICRIIIVSACSWCPGLGAHLPFPYEPLNHMTVVSPSTSLIQQHLTKMVTHGAIKASHSHFYGRLVILDGAVTPHAIHRKGTVHNFALHAGIDHSTCIAISFSVKCTSTQCRF